MNKLALLFPIIAGGCWGSAGVFIRVLYDLGFDNVTITSSRAVITLIILVVFALIKDRSLFRVAKEDIPYLLTIGIVGYTLMNMLYNVSVSSLSMSLASILLCTAPVYVLVFGAFLYGETLTRTRVICMLGALFGCFLLSGIVESGGLKWSLFGIAMGIGSSITNAIYTITMNELSDVRKRNPVYIQIYVCIFGLLPMLPFTDFGVVFDFVSARPLYGTGFMILQALVISFIPNLLFTIGLRYLDSGVASIFASGAEPTSALLFGLLIYHEVPSVFGIIGMVMVITSIIVLGRTDTHSSEHTERNATS